MGKPEYIDHLCPNCNKFHLVYNEETRELYCPAHWCRRKNGETIAMNYPSWKNSADEQPDHGQRVLYFRPQKLTKIGEMIYLKSEKEAFIKHTPFWSEELSKPMVVYKLVRKMKDGSLASLFINKTDRLPINEWLEAKEYPTKGYACRKGWHCTLTPDAPHLSEEGRIWVEVEIKDYEYFDRPESQGGKWILAQHMRIIKELED